MPSYRNIPATFYKLLKKFNFKMSTSILHLRDVEGSPGKRNDVHHKAACGGVEDGVRGNLVFFPGDVQDEEAKMRKERAASDYLAWSYERTLDLLSEKFPNCDLWLMAPSKRAYNTICIYKNFVKSESIMGVPAHCPDHGGLAHMQRLLANAHHEAKGSFDPESSDLLLVGFSKGCIVLNQFLHEIAPESVTENNLSPDFLRRLVAVYWLDGGHSGETDVWVTDADMVSRLARTPLKNARLYLHVSPYQVRDPHRPFKGEAEAEFVRLLRENAFSVEEQLHFEDAAPTLETHFDVLRIF